MRSPVPESTSSGALVATGVRFDQARIYGRTAPLVVEVGCGNGHFLRDCAARYPERDFLGIDLRLRRIDRSCRKAERDSLPNLRFMLGDAVRIFRDELADTPVSRVCVNFPDPWPKYRHRDNRLNRPDSLAAFVERLEPDGELVWVCDYYPQIVDVLVLLEPLVCSGRLGNRFGAAGFGDGIEGYPATLYERRWRAAGRRIYFLRFSRSGSSGPF